MKHLFLIMILFFLQIPLWADCPIYPVPKEYKPGKQVALAPETLVVLGQKASEQERYAADRLVQKIAQRFQITLKIVAENEIAGHDSLIVLGTNESNPLLTRICKENKIELSKKSPGFNGFVIQFVSEKEKSIFLIGGSDVNGVIYGQEAFFDLIKYKKIAKKSDETKSGGVKSVETKSGGTKSVETKERTAASGTRNPGAIIVEAASIRDWPSIAWRGRPHSVLKHHLRSGELDAYVRARLNFSDLRDNPEVKETLLFDARKASMGFPPGKPIDQALVSEMIRQSHQRGIFLYATVSCSIKMDQFAQLAKTYDELLELGADGLWVSMDDTGGGDDPIGLVRKIMQYCSDHGLSGRKIAFTPPPAEYQNIDKPLNHQLAKLPVFNEALWYFTRVPCQADRVLTEKMGLKNKPGWWYNYVETGKTYDPKGGFLNTKWLVTSLRKDGRPGYMDLQPIDWGWGFPNFDKIRDAAQNTSQVHLWGLCGGWPAEYALGMFGLWAWNPEKADFNHACRSIYRYVYGEELVTTMLDFDKKYGELKLFFELPGGWSYKPENQWPRLKDPKNRAEVLKRIDLLEKMAGEISLKAGRESALAPDRLEYCYLEPMRTSLVYARKFASFDFPEYDFSDLIKKHEMANKIKNAKDNFTTSSQKSASVKIAPETKKIIADKLQRFEKDFSELKGAERYLEKWNKVIDIDPTRPAKKQDL